MAVKKRRKNRRTSAVLDPVQIVKDGEAALLEALGQLSIGQLRDTVAEYGMDLSQLMMNWKSIWQQHCHIPFLVFLVKKAK